MLLFDFVVIIIAALCTDDVGIWSEAKWPEGNNEGCVRASERAKWASDGNRRSEQHGEPFRVFSCFYEEFHWWRPAIYTGWIWCPGQDDQWHQSKCCTDCISCRDSYVESSASCQVDSSKRSCPSHEHLWCSADLLLISLLICDSPLLSQTLFKNCRHLSSAECSALVYLPSICYGGHLWNDLYCTEWFVKPCLTAIEVKWKVKYRKVDLYRTLL